MTIFKNNIHNTYLDYRIVLLQRSVITYNNNTRIHKENATNYQHQHWNVSHTSPAANIRMFKLLVRLKFADVHFVRSKISLSLSGHHECQ